MTLLLATAADKNYMERIAPYLHTIAAHGAAFDRRVLITVGCRVEMPDALGTIEAIPLPLDQVLGHTGIHCVQQGCFLEVLECADDDVIIFTDGDIRLQRAATADEHAWMRTIPPWTIGLGWNVGPHDTLAYEAGRIGLDAQRREAFAPLLHRKVYNFGVAICRAATYRALYAAYVRQWPEYVGHTAHYAATQFLLCVCIVQLGIRVWELPPSVHTHGHAPLPPGVEEIDGDGTLAIDGEPVLFRHHWKC